MRLYRVIWMAGAFVLLHMGNTIAGDVTGNAEQGQSLFQSRCAACHSLTANRVGPKLSGVYGRKAGTVADFNYSDAVKSSGVVWNDATLDQWLASPQKFIPGQRMNFSVSDPQQRADIIAYLKSVKSE